LRECAKAEAKQRPFLLHCLVVVEFRIEVSEGQQLAVFEITGPLEQTESAALMSKARQHGLTLELWDLREADLTGWDYHTARDAVDRWREHYAPGVRVAALVRSRRNYAVAFAVKSVAETEQLNLVFDVFAEENAALSWLVSEAPPASLSTIPAPSSGESSD
jgi:hypothetical protein